MLVSEVVGPLAHGFEVTTSVFTVLQWRHFALTDQRDIGNPGAMTAKYTRRRRKNGRKDSSRSLYDKCVSVPWGPQND